MNGEKVIATVIFKLGSLSYRMFIFNGICRLFYCKKKLILIFQTLLVYIVHKIILEGILRAHACRQKWAIFKPGITFEHVWTTYRPFESTANYLVPNDIQPNLLQSTETICLSMPVFFHTLFVLLPFTSFCDWSLQNWICSLAQLTSYLLYSGHSLSISIQITHFTQLMAIPGCSLSSHSFHFIF